MKDKIVTNWNLYPKISSQVTEYIFEADLSHLMETKSPLIARGNGRSYGDASLAPSIISTLKFDRILSFDNNTGVFVCESGLLLSDILDFIVPQGWFLPVTPGTKFITVGGAVASDVHGKNHHSEGSFSQHVVSLKVLSPKNEIIICGPTQNNEFFEFTCGGMGLTGIILEVAFKLKKIETGFIKQVQVKAPDLNTALDLFDEYSHYSYSMAWIDCLKTGKNFGRSILIAGEHASIAQVKSRNYFPESKTMLSVPFDFPSFVLNNLSVKAFNALYYAKNYKNVMNSITPYHGFFYPLDSILHWNRIYGSKGFVQYQFVIPKENGRAGVRDILQRITEKGWGSFLAVLKLFGKQEGIISFHREGYTLALDIPINSKLFAFLDELDKVVRDYGGRIYLTKDARMKAEIFHSTYPNASKFTAFLSKIDPDKKIVSSMSKRLALK